MEPQTMCSDQPLGYTNSWIVEIIPEEGRVARRVASPRMSSVEQPSSKAVASIASVSGGSPGKRYSSRNRPTVDSQLDALDQARLEKHAGDAHAKEQQVEREGHLDQQAEPPSAAVVGDGVVGGGHRRALPSCVAWVIGVSGAT